MKKYYKYLIFAFIIVVVIIKGCSSKPSDFQVLSNRIEEMEKSHNMTSKEIIKRFESIESKITEVEERLIDMNSMIEEASTQEDMNQLILAIDNIEQDMTFVESMIWGSSLFDRNSIKIGDHVSGMMVSNIINRKGMQILFSGEKQLTGTYEIKKDDDYYGAMVTFHIDDKLSNVLPRAKGDRRSLWFRFNNHDEAVDMLDDYGDSGEMTIIIDEYYIDLLESDVINEAKLIKVVLD